MTDPSPFAMLEQTTLERLRQLEERLTTMQRELEHSHRLATVGTITAGIAHEINNVLSPALSYARLAMKRPSDAEMQRKANLQTVECVEAAASILEAILCFSSVEDETRVCSTRETFDSALRCIGRDPSSDLIELNVVIKDDVCVRISPIALQQVFINLLLNATRVLRGRGGRIRVEAHRPIRGNTTIVFSDNGPGFAPEVRDRIFDPFVTAPTRGEKQGGAGSNGGSGLGLAVCRRAIESAGGRISATDTPGGGATFIIELPTAASGVRADAA